MDLLLSLTYNFGKLLGVSPRYNVNVFISFLSLK